MIEIDYFGTAITTDKSGTAGFSCNAFEGSMRLCMDRKGYERKCVALSFAELGGTIPVTLLRAEAELRFKLVDETSKPITRSYYNAFLLPAGEDSGSYILDRRFHRLQWWRTPIHFDRLRTQPYKLWVYLPGFFPFEGSFTPVREAKTMAIPLKRSDTLLSMKIVEDGTDMPATGVYLVAIPVSWEPMGKFFRYQFYLDHHLDKETNRFRFPLPPGSYRVEIPGLKFKYRYKAPEERMNRDRKYLPFQTTMNIPGRLDVELKLFNDN
jgi:hypothetical protein